MRLRTLLILGSAAAALPPLLLLGYAATEVATRALTGKVAQLHSQQADSLASYTDSWLTGRAHAVSLLREAFPVEDLSYEGQVGFERLVYNQLPEVNIVSLVTPEGADLAPSQMVRPGSPVPPGHQAVSSERFSMFRSRLPLDEIEDGAILVGRPYAPPGGGAPVAPMVFAGIGDGAPVLAVELSLAPLVRRMELVVTPTTELAMLDAEGEPFARTGDLLVEPAHFEWFLDGVPSAELRYSLEHGEETLAAFSRVEGTGWLAVVAEPYAIATASARDIRWRASWFGLVAIALAGAFGVHFSRKIHRPVVQLRDAARAVGEGDLGREVQPDPIGELGELGDAFNTMSAQLARDAARIREQRAEIQAFNEELQQRVEDRTRELREAQAQLVESGRLAAVAELGAGLAHELNNPLAGILGLTQLLAQRARDAGDAEVLEAIESQARRCADIVSSLLAFTRETIDHGELEVVDLDRICREVLVLVRPAFELKEIELRHREAQVELPVRADPATLGRALAQLLTSLRALVAPGGVLTIEGRSDASEILLELRLSGMKPVKNDADRDDWFASGMSLWVARRILAEHGGRLEEPDGSPESPYILALPKA
jgi:two-component system NtrC family sensor kinase